MNDVLIKSNLKENLKIQLNEDQILGKRISNDCQFEKENNKRIKS